MTDETAHRTALRRWIVYGLMALTSVAVLRIPLCNYLGYEYSTAVALILPWVLGPYLILMLRGRRRAPSYGATVTNAMTSSLCVVALPFVLGIANVVFVRNCSLAEGALFYMLLPGVTGLLIVSIALFAHAAFRRPIFWYLVMVLAILSYGLYLGYATPQIYSYNLLYGFFPGFSYDEVLSVTPTLVFFRILTLVVAAFFIVMAEFFWLTRWNNPRARGEYSLRSMLAWRRFPIVFALALLLAAAWILRDRLGFETSDAYLLNTLDGELSTPHFRIHYVRGSFTDEELLALGTEHEFRYNQVARALRTQESRPIASFIYPDEETQYRMIGTKVTNISKPWRREIHTSKTSWEQTLRHELVHAMAGEFGMPIIHAHYNIGLVEGLAMAVDGDFGNHTLHEYAAGMLDFDIVKKPEQLITPVGFALQSSTVSYVLMGSFCRYLIDRYGIAPFKGLYGGRSPSDVYGRTYDELIGDWKEFLAGFEVKEEWRPHFDFYFRRPSIFAKLCARRIANLNEKGYDALARDSQKVADDFFRRSYRLSPNSEAYAGLMRSAYAARQYDSLLQLFRGQDSVLRASTRSLDLLRGDALWALDSVGEAAAVVRGLLALDLSERLNQAAATRLALFDRPIVASALRPILLGSASDSVRAHLLDSLKPTLSDPVFYYILAKSQLRRRQFSAASSILFSIVDSLPYPQLRADARMMLGQAFFHRRDYQQARIHFWSSLNDLSTAIARQRVDDWLDRALWYDRNASASLRRRSD